MDTEKIDIEKNITLEQVRASIEIVESARADQSLSPDEKSKLELAVVRLRDLERSIIESLESDLVASLIADSRALKALTAQIKQSADKLSGVASAIEKAGTVVESLIKVITTAAGLL
ncbi:MAG: hypothetical protein ABI707_14135 [Ferruginibacter sp.]